MPVLPSREKSQHVFQCPSCGKEHDFSRISQNLEDEFHCDNPKCDLPPRFKSVGRLTDAESERLRLRLDDVSWSRPYVFQAGEAPDAPWIIAEFTSKVQRFEPRSLTDVISESVLRGMLTGFGDDKGCTLSIVEVSDRRRIEPVKMHDDVAEVLGIPVHRRTPFRNFAPLCLALRTASSARLPDPKHPCERFDATIVGQVIEDDASSTMHYHCPAGLVDFACPIRVAGRIVAVLLSGQRRVTSYEAEAKISKQLPAFRCGMRH